MKWNKEVNKAVMECFYRSKPFDEEGKPVRGYRQRMFREWRDRGLFESILLIIVIIIVVVIIIIIIIIIIINITLFYVDLETTFAII